MYEFVFSFVIGMIKVLTYEDIANRIIPLLLSITITANLNHDQFNTFMTAIRNMLNIIEKARKKVIFHVVLLTTLKGIGRYGSS